MLDSKLQIKSGQTLALVNNPDQVDVAAPQAAPDAANARPRTRTSEMPLLAGSCQS